jgi:hypothetical protein
MKTYEATEQAYKNGYEKGKVDALKHGRWEDGCAVDHNGKKVYDSIDCSVCEEYFKIEPHNREYWKKRFKVCPFCGAIMDLPNITEQTQSALEAMDRKAHGGE